MEDVGDAQREAHDDAEHARPVIHWKSARMVHLTLVKTVPRQLARIMTGRSPSEDAIVC